MDARSLTENLVECRLFAPHSIKLLRTIHLPHAPREIVIDDDEFNLSAVYRRIGCATSPVARYVFDGLR